MPQLVAILHSFVGAAAVLVGIATALDHDQVFTGIERRIHDIEIFVGVFVGAITFTGSVVAFGKLQGLIGSKPLLLPGRHVLNLVMLLACVYLGYTFVTYGDYFPVLWPLLVVTAIASLLGIHLVMAIGGADMPVVVSMLNSYSGWAAAAAGFMLENDLLIITGALVGSSGAILSYIMCARDEPIVPQRDPRRLRRRRRRGAGRRVGAAGRRGEVGDAPKTPPSCCAMRRA